MLPSPLPRLPIAFLLRRFLAQLLVYHGLRVIGLADIERALPAPLPVVEVPIRPAFRQSPILAPVGTLFELEHAVAVITPLHHGAHWFVTYLVPPAGYGLLQPV